MKRSLHFISIAFFVLIALSSCAPASVAPTNTSAPTATTLPPTATLVPPTEAPTAEPLVLQSQAFAANTSIPEQYTCKGKNISPPLKWNTIPAGTQTFAIILDDPDAVQVVGYVWDHWLVFNIPGVHQSIAENISDKPELPDGTRHGKNSFGHLNYGGPCPPNTHHYRLTLYAVDSKLALDPGASKDQLLKALQGHILAQAELIGLYP